MRLAHLSVDACCWAGAFPASPANNNATILNSIIGLLMNSAFHYCVLGRFAPLSALTRNGGNSWVRPAATSGHYQRPCDRDAVPLGRIGDPGKRRDDGTGRPSAGWLS